MISPGQQHDSISGIAADHVGNGPFDLHLNHLAVVQTYGLSVRRRVTALAGILAVKPLPGAFFRNTLRSKQWVQ